MTQVTKEYKAKMGANFSDRKNSFDDSKESIVFQKFLKDTNSGLSEYLLKELNLPKPITIKYEYKPTSERDMKLPLYYYKDATFNKYGKTNDVGIDACFKNKDDDIVCIFDFERSTKWGSLQHNKNWPAYWSNISFLERKAHFCDHDVNFFMVYFNTPMTKLLIVNKKDIIPFSMENVILVADNMNDIKRKLPYDRGYIFGDNLTDIEKRNFNDKRI